MIEKSGGRGLGRSALAARHDDVDDDIYVKMNNVLNLDLELKNLQGVSKKCICISACVCAARDEYMLKNRP